MFYTPVTWLHPYNSMKQVPLYYYLHYKGTEEAQRSGVMCQQSKGEPGSAAVVLTTGVGWILRELKLWQVQEEVSVVQREDNIWRGRCRNIEFSKLELTTVTERLWGSNPGDLWISKNWSAESTPGCWVRIQVLRKECESPTSTLVLKQIWVKFLISPNSKVWVFPPYHQPVLWYQLGVL